MLHQRCAISWADSTGKGNKTRLLQVPLLEQDKEEESIASQSAPFRGLLSLICLIAIISRAASSSRSSRNDQHQAGSLLFLSN